MNEPISNISVIGLGKLGSPMAAVLADAGFNVIGTDLNETVINQINEGIAPVEEPQLQQLIDGAKPRLRATSDIQDLVLNTSVTFIIVPTPSQEDHQFTNKYVLSAIENIGRILAQKDSYHLVVLSSTVMPGSMDREIKTKLESTSGRKVAPGDLGLCYSPEFIALGSVVKDMHYPDLVLIGESDPMAGDMLESVYAQICKNTPAIERMNFVNAELTKISINTYVTTKISYANMLAELCDHLPNADSYVVSQAVGQDSRIGKKYLTGAVGYGGPCFPRDNRAFAALGSNLGVNCDLAVATDIINFRQIDRLFNFVNGSVSTGDTVAVLGLSYKTDTGETEQSQGMMLCHKLLQAGLKIKAHDPMVTDEKFATELSVEHKFNDLQEATKGVKAIVIVNGWPEYKEIAQIADSQTTIIDPWRICEASKNVNYIRMGFGEL